MGEHHSNHEPGSMDIRAQEKTFDGFVWAVSRGFVAVLVILVLLALVNG
ncbi:MAG: hypothetical protein RIT14_1098 [Pseudomonadota bacterium]|jgi:hypothetical protein